MELIVQLEKIAGFWLDWQIRAALVALVVLFAAASAHWRSPVWRHWVLVVGSVCLILLPAILAIVPTWQLEILPRELHLAPFAPSIQFDAHLSEPKATETTNYWLITLFLLSVALSVMLIARYWIAWTEQRRALTHALPPNADVAQLFDECVTEIGLGKTKPMLKILCSTNTPCTLGWRSPTVLLSPEICRIQSQADGENREKLRIVLLHELYHIKRNDWLSQQLVNIAVFLNPLNPLVWRAKLLTQFLAEESVDKSVLSHSVQPSKYAETLLQQLQVKKQIFSGVAVQMYRRGDIVERVDSLISEPYSWSDIGSAQRFFLAGMVGLAIFPAVTLSITQKPEVFSEISIVAASNTVLSEPNQEAPRKESIGIVNVVPVAPFVVEEAPVLQVTTQSHWGSVSPEPLQMLLGSDFSNNPISPELVLSIPVEPKPSYLAMPSYPSRALDRGWEARVDVEFDLDESGGVVNPRVLNPGDRRARLFEQAAIKAIKESRYDLDPEGDEIFIQRDLIQTYNFQIAEKAGSTASDQLPLKPP